MDQCTVVYRDTISRRGKKPKFEYRYASKKKISDKKRKEIEKTYIPYTWDEVEIYLGHPKLIATGMLKNQLRYLYQKEFTNKRSKEKYARLYKFGKRLDFIKQSIVKQLTSKCPSRTKVIATALWLLTTSCIRVGNEKYLKENNTYGLLTLKKSHVKFNNGDVCLDFIGKKSIRNKYTVCIGSAPFARWLRYLYDHANPFFFQYDNRRVTAADLNSHIQEHYGAFTAKDFRTWGANIEFLKAIRKIKSRDLTTKRECQRELKKAIECVSIKLNNTIAVCKSNYICKAIISDFQEDPIKFVKKVQRNKSNHNLLSSLLKKLT